MSLILSACNSLPEGDPKEIIESYYDNIHSQDYESAYEMLSKQNKELVDFEKFVLWQSLLRESDKESEENYEFDDIKENQEIDGTNYEYSIRTTVKSKVMDINSDQPENISEDHYLVSEDGEWKVLRLKEYFLIDLKISNIYQTLAYYQSKDENENKDLLKAIEYTNKALEYDPNNMNSYYTKSLCLLDLNRNEESLDVIIKALQLDFDNNILESDFYNLKGINQENLGQIEEAKKSYNEAIKLNPNNQYAINNLKFLE